MRAVFLGCALLASALARSGVPSPAVCSISNRSDSLTVSSARAEADVNRPDPSQKVFVHDEILDANPGGIKAPQYFAPGFAGDHGEPSATFFQVGGYLVPNKLSANAHGNGYADPDMIVPAIH